MKTQDSNVRPAYTELSLYRFYFANKYAFILGGSAHLCFIPIFYYLNITTLVLYNIFSLFIFGISYVINEKGYYTLSTILVAMEVMLHAILATNFIGWESGFFYYSLAIIPFIFSNPKISGIQKIIIAIVISNFYLLLKYYSNHHAPFVILEKDIINTLYYINSFSIILGISAIVYYFGLASDITENKIGQERYEADLANKAKSTFLANMSHELRTPLNAIIGYSEMLKEDAKEQGNKQANEDLTKITNAGSHLLEIINNLLDLTKIEAGKTELECRPTDISPLINDVASTIIPLAAKNNNVLTINCKDDFGFAFIDQTKVKQILFNILSNACKFTHDGDIELSVYKEDLNSQDWLCFIISDAGIGVAQDKFEVLFQPFIQADVSTTRLYGGTGLGLTISKHFINLMQGTIDVESIPNEGTTFSIKIPITNLSNN